MDRDGKWILLIAGRRLLRLDAGVGGDRSAAGEAVADRVLHVLALDEPIDAGDRRFVGGRLDLALLHHPLGAVDRQARCADEEREHGRDDQRNVAALVAAQLADQPGQRSRQDFLPHYFIACW